MLECTVVDLMVTEPVAKPVLDTHREQDVAGQTRAVTLPCCFARGGNRCGLKPVAR